MIFTLHHQQTLVGIPSASGIVKWREALYVVGDNSALLYQLDQNYKIKQEHILLEGFPDRMIPKLTKPDFEAMTSCLVMGKSELLIFGSGSKFPQRNYLIRVGYQDSLMTRTYPLTDFYNHLSASQQMKGQLLNIEAATTIYDTLFLFNRENNLLWKLSVDDFLSYLEGKTDIPKIYTYQLNLPRLNNLQIKISGASAVIDENLIVFTASVEDTPNPIDDGEIMGSYLGIISVENLKDGYRPKCVPITDGKRHIPVKVESVEVLKSTDSHNLQLVLVTDSDGGESELLSGDLSW